MRSSAISVSLLPKSGNWAVEHGSGMILSTVNLPETAADPVCIDGKNPAFIFGRMLILAGLLISSCSASPRFIRTASGDTVGVLEERITCPKKVTEKQESKAIPTHGKASYYGDKFHGRKTASGERYDRTLLTAAHRTLPFGTMVTVRNLLNSKTVVVRVNDRGPHKKSRIIDLSYAAAEKIGMCSKGIVPVEIEIIKE